jgi:hypothetical protein
MVVIVWKMCRALSRAVRESSIGEKSWLAVCECMNRRLMDSGHEDFLG